MKILLVEDNKSIIKGLEYAFAQNGYSCEYCLSLDEAVRKAPFNYDAAVLDIMLPDGNGFDLLLNSILKECNYRSVGYASWDFKRFDILMDGVPKSEDQGKGYRSFLNSVVALMFYDYFNRDGVYIKPGILMIDTPLLGFDENEDGFEGETIKNGLYQYFINHRGDGQVIIVDNLNVIPDIDFAAKGINVITYHKDEKNGHVYGFMPSWRKDLPKEKV